MAVPDNTMNRAGAPVRDLGLAELAEAIAGSTITSVAATTDALDRIEASQPSLNAFRIVRRERALTEAAEADRRIAAGERLPLLGVPIAVKDDTDIAGEPTAFGAGGDFAPKTEDAESVRRLRAAGAVIVGKTNTCEYGQLPFTSGAAFGHTRNPWGRAHTPGGSSGGSSAAVAAGLVPAALGSDGAGSVRIPAAWTNLVGIKPQRGRISTWPLAEAFNGLTVNGPLARTVGDAALLLDAAAGPHHGDKHTPAPLTLSDAVGRDPGRLRIALSLNIPFTATRTELHPEVEAGVHHIAKTLRELGHSVTVTNLHYGVMMGASFLPRSMAGIRAVHDRMPGARVDPRTIANVRTGQLLSGPALFAARQAETLLHRRIGRFFDDFDVVLAPTTATPPPRAEEIDDIGVVATNNLITAACPYTWPWNVLGWPSVNVPAGFTATGLPVGAQLMGTANTEPLLVSLAAQLESELHWERQRPESWW
ncbi:amidase [Nocardia cyriacigeorgica]|uniref:amidase n=2 Tax=Nocardia cyriacigeorgica TaxID=135487 RepID=A0A6P1DFB2_9NOCA|nr:amidase [Nocardia cyriacigeorgica]NEW42581.1 amidase [Nocardia cyriacigeorgica]NEW47283.1 amidase [Nocardia cyriacigeorgica]NEW53686.1 amidase [Nocardia cyriacigeorgica]NEW58836.1 amidase [Nocardia cyriacigeorgica]